MARKEPNPLTARPLRVKPYLGVVDLSQEREVTAKDLLRTRRKKKGKRGKRKAPRAAQGFTAASVAEAVGTLPEREVTAADILKRRRR